MIQYSRFHIYYLIYKRLLRAAADLHLFFSFFYIPLHCFYLLYTIASYWCTHQVIPWSVAFVDIVQCLHNCYPREWICIRRLLSSSDPPTLAVPPVFYQCALPFRTISRDNTDLRYSLSDMGEKGLTWGKYSMCYGFTGVMIDDLIVKGVVRLTEKGFLIPNGLRS